MRLPTDVFDLALPLFCDRKEVIARRDHHHRRVGPEDGCVMILRDDLLEVSLAHAQLLHLRKVDKLEMKILRVLDQVGRESARFDQICAVTMPSPTWMIPIQSSVNSVVYDMLESFLHPCH